MVGVVVSGQWDSLVTEGPHAFPKRDDAIVVYNSGNLRFELYFDDCISTAEGPLILDIPSVRDQNLRASLELIEAVR